MDTPFRTLWPLAPLVIDYMRERLACSPHDACLALQNRFLDGSVRTRGPIESGPVVEINAEFWRYAFPDFDGRAHNMSTFQRLPWFEIAADDVLRIWPRETAAPPVARTAFPRAREHELRSFLLAGMHPNERKAHATAEKYFGKRIDRDLVRKIRRENSLSGRAGAPRKPRAKL
jgi:hypothetical protein